MTKLVRWTDIGDAADTLGAFIQAEGLNPNNPEDNDKLWEMAGLDEEGFNAYVEDYIAHSRQAVAEILRGNEDPVMGLISLSLMMVSAHLTGVTAGAAATRQAVTAPHVEEIPAEEVIARTDDLRGERDR